MPINYNISIVSIIIAIILFISILYYDKRNKNKGEKKFTNKYFKICMIAAVLLIVFSAIGLIRLIQDVIIAYIKFNS